MPQRLCRKGRKTARGRSKDHQRRLLTKRYRSWLNSTMMFLNLVNLTTSIDEGLQPAKDSLNRDTIFMFIASTQPTPRQKTIVI